MFLLSLISILLAILMCLAAFMARRDLLLLQQGLKRCLRIGSGERDFPGLPLAASGRDASLVLRAIYSRLESLQWAHEHAQVDTLRQQSGAASAQTNSLEEGLLIAVMQRFRCSAAALVIISDREPVQLQIFTHGVSGRRFEAHLESFVSVHGKCEKMEGLGLHDGAESKSVCGDFSLFGVRYTVCFPLSKMENGSSLAGYLWLGYPLDRSPLAVEVEEARSTALALGQKMENHFRLKEINSRLAEMQDSDRQKSEFIAQMSHDIRSPLNNVRSILTLLKLDRTSSGTDEMIDVALSNCASLAELVEGILDYSRHKAGKLSASPRLFDLAACAEDVFANYLVSARLKGLDLTFQNDFGRCLVFADSRHVKRVISNLLSNAIKYTRAGRVIVSIGQGAAGQWSVRVQDTGCGLSPEQQKALFTPFTTFAASAGSKGPSESAGGIGLGLALSKILAEMNGGSVQVRSAAGHGAEFSVILPGARAATDAIELMQQAEAPLVTRAGDSGARRISEKRPSETTAAPYSYSVMLVDDEPDCVDTLERGLNLPQVRILKAYTLRDAISICNFDPPNLVLSDAEMSGGGGKSLLKFMRTQGKNAVLGILTGRDGDEIRAEYMSLGADQVFLKPVEIAELQKWILAAMRKSPECVRPADGQSLVA